MKYSVSLISHQKARIRLRFESYAVTEGELIAPGGICDAAHAKFYKKIKPSVAFIGTRHLYTVESFLKFCYCHNRGCYHSAWR